MTIEKIQKDMILAMKAHDKVRKDALSSLMSAIKKVAIDGGVRNDIPEEMVDKTILKELKQTKEQIDTCPKDRKDLMEEYKARYMVIEEYAPSMMSEDEIREELEKEFAKLLDTGNKGAIMKEVMPYFAGKADGALINKVVASFCK